MLGRVAIVGFIGAVVLLAVLLQVSTPTSIGPLGILIVFILMYIAVLGALTFLFYGVSRVIAKLASPFTVKRPLQPMSLRRAYFFSSVLALVPVMFIGMQSVGEVGPYDVFLVILFAIIACVYIAKKTA